MDTATLQRVRDLVYDLLPEAEAVELRRRIEDDAELAEAYRAAQAEAALFTEAARLAVPKITLRRPEKAAAALEPLAQTAGKGVGPQRSPWARVANWVVGAAAAVLLAISLGGYWYHRGQLAGIAADHLRLVVAGPAALHPGVPAQYTVATTAVTGTAMPSQVEFALYDGDKLLWKRSEKTEEDGRLQVVVPADHKAPDGARLQVLAVHQDKLEQVQTRLHVEPAGYAAHLDTDKRLYRPGETVFYRAVVLSQFGLSAGKELPTAFKILDPAGRVVARSQSTAKTDRGVAGGAFAVAERLADGRYTLVARSPDRAFAEVRRPFFIRQSEQPLASGDAAAHKAAAKPSPADDGVPAVAFYPEGGALAAGLENRVIFTAHTAGGKAADIRGAILDGSNTEVAAIETTSAGMGSFVLTPVVGEQYRLKISSPAGIKAEPRLPPTSRDAKIALTSAGVFDVGQPVECQVRTSASNLPLVVAAWCGDLQIAQQILVTTAKDTKAGQATPVTIPLPEQVGGVIRLIAYDYSENPPKPLAERFVYRRTPQRLNLRVTGLKERYAPGEKVELRVTATDESGKPVPAVLGVRGTDETLLSLAPDRAADLPTDFLLTAGLGEPDDLARPEFYLADSDEAKAALGLFLGTRGGQPPSGPGSRDANPHPGEKGPSQWLASDGTPLNPPAVFDNLKDIRKKYDESLSDYRARRSGILNALTAVSFFAGLGLVLLVVMLGLLRIVWGLHLWMPAVGVTVCCLIIGAVLMDPSRGRTSRDGAVAFATFDSVPAKVAMNVAEKAADEGAAKGTAQGAAAKGEGIAKSAAADGGLGGAEKQAENHAPGAGGRMTPPQAAMMMRSGAPADGAFGSDRGKGAGGAAPPGTGRSDAMAPAAANRALGGGVQEAASPPLPKPLWRPLLVADRDGRASLSFTMPQSGGSFRVLIEAHGKGRVGATTLKLTPK